MTSQLSLSLRASALQHLWTLWDRPDGQSMLHAGRHALEDLVYLEEQGLLTFHGLSSHCACVDCESIPAGGCVLESVYEDDAGKQHFLVSCEQEGIFEVSETRLYQYRPVTGDALARVLATRVQCDGVVEAIVPHRLWSLGRYGARSPLFLAREAHRQDAATVLAPLHERIKGSHGVVLVPDDLPAVGVLPANAVAVRMAQVWWWVGEMLDISTDAIDDTITGLGGNKPFVYLQPLEVPTGFTWAQVRLEFISDEDVRIWIVGEPVVRNFAELGLANARDQQPNRLWKLLREFAAYEGVYNPDHRSVLYPPVVNGNRGSLPRLSAFSPKLTTGLTQLADHLQKLFPTIPGRPFTRYDSRNHQYRAQIKLCWEPGYRQRMAREYAITV